MQYQLALFPASITALKLQKLLDFGLLLPNVLPVPRHRIAERGDLEARQWWMASGVHGVCDDLSFFRAPEVTGNAQPCSLGRVPKVSHAEALVFRLSGIAAPLVAAKHGAVQVHPVYITP